MKYGEMIGRNIIRIDETFIYVSNDAIKRQAVKKYYSKSIVTDMQSFLSMENMRIPIYVDEFLPELNRMVNQLGAKIVHVPRDDRERGQSVDFLGNKIYDEIRVQRVSYERGRKENEENEKRQHQAKLDKLEKYLEKNYPKYVDEQCKYILENACGGYDDESISKKTLDQEERFSLELDKSIFWTPEVKEEKKKTLHSTAEELKEVRYSDVLSNCIYNSVFMREYMDAVGHLFLWSKVKTDFSTFEINKLSRKMVKTVNPEEIMLFRLIHFWRNGVSGQRVSFPSVMTKRETDTVDEIRDALNRG